MEKTDNAVVASQTTVIERFLRHEGNAKNVLEIVPASIVIFNNDREIVYANSHAKKIAGGCGKEEIVGKRAGDVFECSHVTDGIKCGNTMYCEVCGLANAIVSGQKGRSERNECRVALKNGTALDLCVNSYPVTAEGERFVVCTILDIGGSKRRELLEQVFFHDVLNTACSILGYAELIREKGGTAHSDLAESLYISVMRLIDEIQGQRQIVSAECGDMVVSPERLDSLELIRTAKLICSSGKVSFGKTIHIDGDATSESFISDGSLIRRVLNNMLKNALEASYEGDIVLIGCNRNNDKIKFWVKNKGHISSEDQLRIFNRSFSTKGQGRGVGTYSMKLLSERYLKGKVDFSSSEETGTVFSASYPISI